MAQKDKGHSTPVKRMKQNKKHNLHHRSFKSRVRTAIQAFKIAFSSKDIMQMRSSFKIIYSLMDKGVKNGVYKKNKAARTKAQIALSLQKGIHNHSQ